MKVVLYYVPETIEYFYGLDCLIIWSRSNKENYMGEPKNKTSRHVSTFSLENRQSQLSGGICLKTNL